METKNLLKNDGITDGEIQINSVKPAIEPIYYHIHGTKKK